EIREERKEKHAPAVVKCTATQHRPLVLNTYEIQSTRGRSRTGRRPVPRLEDARYIFNLQRPLAYENERAHQVPHHVVQKSRAPNGVDQLVPQTLPRRRKYIPGIGYGRSASLGSAYVGPV